MILNIFTGVLMALLNFQTSEQNQHFQQVETTQPVHCISNDTKMAAVSHLHSCGKVADGCGFEVSAIASCPHVAAAVTTATSGAANAVKHSGSPLVCASCRAPCAALWVCISCGYGGCSRDEQEHALTHSRDTAHYVALGVNDMSVWCFVCDAYLDVFLLPDLHPFFTAAYMARFGEAPVLPTVRASVVRLNVTSADAVTDG